MSSSNYEELLQRCQELSDLGAVQALMSWDQETFMPPAGQPARGRQMAALSALSHQKMTSPEMGQLLEKLQGPEAPEDSDARTTVERMAWSYERSTRVPEKLVREMTEAQSASVNAWAEAREKDDFPAFLPHLKRLLDLSREEADLLKEDGQSRYDALLQSYERGASSAEIGAVFSELRDALTPLVQAISEKADAISDDCLHQAYAPEKQIEFGKAVLRDMGFDFNRGRLDRSAHPFTSGFHPQDVRMTTKLDPQFFNPGFFATVHEGGHALYEQGYLEADYGTPLGSSISLGIHESQSRAWENLLGRSLPFWRYYYPALQQMFPEALTGVDLEDFYKAVNRVEPSLIRIEADEVTYSLHIILRFELEQALLEGDLSPEDLPEAWNEKVQQYLAVEVPSNRQGCMQDIHWAWGLLGYFPTYTLGNLYAAQFHQQAHKDIPDLQEAIEKGELQVFTQWLRENIHQVGQRRLAPELVQDITGKPLSAQPFILYLKEKYTALYGIEGV